MVCVQMADCQVIHCLNVGMHSDILESIWFKLGVTIDTVIRYMLILVYLTMIVNHVTLVRESKDVCAYYLREFLIDLDRSWYTVESY